MKVSRKYVVLAFALVVVLLLVAIGYFGLVANNKEKNAVTTVDAEVNVAVRVMDLVNGTPVAGAPVYFIACCPNGSILRDVHASDVTLDDGWALFSANYTLDSGQVIYLGASNRKSILDADFASLDFNGTGYLGVWKSFNYSVLYNSEDHKAAISCTINLDLDSGKMI
jgi:hypothetical protein